MARYRKKPVVIEAVHFDQYSENREAPWFSDNPQWLEDAFVGGEINNVGRAPKDVGGPIQLHIKTLEGTMIASRGDWIIRGVKGEIYPCKPDIFAATYEDA